MQHLAFLCLTALFAGSCAGAHPHQPAPSGKATVASVSAPKPPVATPEAVPTAVATATAPGLSWVESVRLDRWRDAAIAIDALPPAEQRKPAVRYVRARAAISTGDSPRAVALLVGMETELPAIAHDVGRWRAEAQVDAGPYLEAAEFLTKSTSAHDLSLAAVAYERATELDEARRTADRAVAAASRTSNVLDELEARTTRARLRQLSGPSVTAEADLRWIAVHAPTTRAGQAAVDALDKLHLPVSTRERRMAANLVVDGIGDESQAAVERMAVRPPATTPDALHARGIELFKARAFEQAATTFMEAARSATGPNAAESLFFAARSLARDGRDKAAIEAYQELLTKYRKTPAAERTELNLARLFLQDGRFGEAVASYTAYLAQHRGSDRQAAEYERALAQLSTNEAAKARKTFAELGRRLRGDDAAKMRQLEGVAALRAGERDEAVALWTEVARNLPLSWAAQMARTRLIAVNATLPPLLDPPDELDPPKLELALPEGPALLASIGLDGDAEARIAASEREASADYSGREGEALCVLYGHLARGKRRYRTGVNAVTAQVLNRTPTVGERWAWECLYPEPFSKGVKTLEDHYGLPHGLVYAIMRQESAFDPGVVSPAHAVGLMQLMPGTARRAAMELAMDIDTADLRSPDVSLRLGAFYISKLLKMFQGNIILTAAAYNAGPKVVAHWVEAGADLDADLWVARIPYEETRIYVSRVMQNFARYQWLSGGDAAVPKLSLDLPSNVHAAPDAY